LQLAVRGSAEALREKPLSSFPVPSAPLKWSDVTPESGGLRALVIPVIRLHAVSGFVRR